MSKRNLGDLGESILSTWTAQRDIVANPSIKDRGGWDYHLQLPPGKDSSEYPLDERPPEISCMIQVKATDHNKGRIDKIKLSNWERMAKSPLPYFFLVLEFARKNDVQQAYLVHVDKFWVENTLKSLRKVKKEEANSIHKKYLSLVFNEEQKLDSLNGEGLEKAIYKYVGNLKDYIERKSQWDKTFLMKIGYPKNKWYGKIGDLFVAPKEYEDIKKTIKEKRIVFITGTREFGKTYTAVRLMWEYYNKGYQPKWVKGGELTQRIEVRERLENIEAELKPDHIIYFEDPFGKARYEEREGLEREIGTIIENVNKIKEVYVIITSREEVFKEFKKEKLSSTELEEFEQRLNIKKPSYNIEKRKEILLKLSESENCKWLKNEKLKKSVIKLLENKNILPTPLSIKDFVVATINIIDESKIKIKLEEKSNETARAFADEIKEMSEDKILFLSFLFISNDFEIEFIRENYDNLLKEIMRELNLKNVWEFDRVFNWFKDDKINIIDRDFKENRLISFSHPSYSEALDYLLVKNGYFTKINQNIFCKLLIKLSDDRRSTKYVAQAITYKFNMLPENIRNTLLSKLSKDERSTEYVAKAIAENFDMLPEDVRIKLLLKLSEDYRTANYIARIIAENFDMLPEDVRIKLLLKLSEDYRTAEYIARTIAENFDKLPENVNELLFKLSENDKASKYVAKAIAENFDKLPENVNELLFKLSEDDKASKYVVQAIAENFDKLPENVNELLFKLSEDDKASKYVAQAIAENFDKLPENVNELLFKLSEDDNTAGAVSKAVRIYFDKFPKNVRNELLLTLSKNSISKNSMGPINVLKTLDHYFDILPQNMRNEVLIKFSLEDWASEYVSRIVVNNFDSLPEDMRNSLLIKLSKKEKAVLYVSQAVANNFNRLPENVRNLLFTFPQKPKAVLSVAKAVAYNFNKLPENVKNLLFTATEAVVWDITRNFNKLPENVRNLLFILSEKDDVARSVASAVAFYFDRLPENVRNLLFILSEKDDVARSVAEAIIRNFNELPENVRNLLFILSEKDGVARSIAEAIIRNFNELPENVRNLLFILSEKDDVARSVPQAIIRNFNELPENVRNLLFILSEKDDVIRRVAESNKIQYFKELPKKARTFYTFSDDVGVTQLDKIPNFSELLENIKNKLLLIISEKNRAIGPVEKEIVLNFDKFPKNLKFKLLHNFHEKSVYEIKSILASNFHKLPKNLRQELLLMLTLSKAIALYFDKLPENVKSNLLCKLSEKIKISMGIEKIIIEKFNNPIEEINNKFFWE